jgi:hypothetical protein
MEQWKSIKGYEGYYEVSNLGNVKRLKTIIDAPYMKDSGYRTIRTKILKLLNRSKKGYKVVALSAEGITKRYSIHRLVAIHFITNPNNYTDVMHLDNNPHNNSIDNLIWGTKSMNMKQAVKDNRWNNQYTK